MLYYSPRAVQLALFSHPKEPTLTVELFEKWYSLFLVHPNGQIEEVPFPDDPESCPADVSAYRDHAPNPEVVVNFARNHDYQVDNLSLELIVGRWELSNPDHPIY